MAAQTHTIPEKPPKWREILSGRWGRLTAGLLLLEVVVAVQALVVATIMPDIRRDLGMVELYGLAYTLFSLATIGAIPMAGRAVDRFGPQSVLLVALGLFASGLLVAATAPAMPVILIGQFLEGAGAGGLYAMSLGTVAKAYPDRLRARVLGLLAAMWILPGLAAPPMGALIASTVGWRWAYIAPMPLLLLGWLLIAPALALAPRIERDHGAVPVKAPLLLMLGAGLFFSGLTIVRPWALVMLAAGLAMAVPALVRLVPRGTFRASPGAPASGLSALLLSAGFFTMNPFLTLMLTHVRGISLAEASIAVTTASVTWGLGSVWQSGRATRIPLRRLLTLGTLLAIGGEAVVASTLSASVPLLAAYLGWAVVGAGMGIAFPTIPLAMMRLAGEGEESGELSAVLLMDMLGVATGAGLGGGAIALSAAFGASLALGIGGSFAMGFVALALLLWTGRRIVSRR